MYLVLLILAGAVAWLWRRLDLLEREFARLQRGEVAKSATPATPSEPAVSEEVEPEPFPLAAAEQEAVEPARGGWRPRFDFEDVFGRLLPIWAGGITLAVAGFFLVRWSIDAGLLTPPVRVLLAGLFGLLLIAGAEAAYRWRERVADPRVAQALAGAGLATLYAAFYLAGTAYGLIGSTLAFLGLAAVTAAAIALSYRFGLPSAVLGLVGGFAAPALVGSEQANLPLLTLYLGLVTAGLALTGRRQDRAWLGMAALAGGLGWGALLIGGAVVRPPDIPVLGVYLILLGAVVPAVSGGDSRPHWLVRLGAAALAALQLALLVQHGGFGALEWSLYLLLGGALAWFGWRQPEMREANAVAAAVGVALLLAWPDPAARALAAVSLALAAIFAGVPLAQIRCGHARPLDFAQTGAVALGIALAALWHFGELLPEAPQPVMALALFALACLPAAAVVLAGLVPERSAVRPRIVVEVIAALIAFAALAQVIPHDGLAWLSAILAAAFAWRARSLVGVSGTLAFLAALWAIEPLFLWLQAGSYALVGVPMTPSELPVLRAVALHLLPGIAGAMACVLTMEVANKSRAIIGGAAVAAMAVAGHIAFRHLFAVLAGDDFTGTGVIERALWQSLLLTGAWLAWTRGWRQAAIALGATTLAHFVWFSLALHNPLWSEQAVGGVPIANALLPMFGVSLAALLLLRRWLPRQVEWLRWTIDGALMAVIAMFALSELRQLFAGSLLNATSIGQTEDLLRSLLGIVLAIGLLLWGARSRERSWRIGSLVLMVIAVLKVFLVDAAGLEGLGRIASFMALGFSLIGIGWFYARQLKAPGAPAAP